MRLRNCLKIQTVCNIAAVSLLTFTLAPNGMAQQSQEIEDAWLEGRLDTLIELDPNLNSLGISSDVVDGEAILAGNVTSLIEKEFAGEIAESIEGILRVNNDLVVVESPMAPQTMQVDARDKAITAAINTKLLLSTALRSAAIEVETHNGYVQLKGTVATGEDRTLAQTLARETYGVERLQNFLQITQQ